MVTQKRYYKFKLRKPNTGKEETMKKAVKKFKEAINSWLEQINEMGEYPNRGNTHRYGYKEVREKYPKLYSETVQEAMNRAIQIYRSNGMSKYREDSMSFKKRFIEINSHFIRLPLLRDKKPWLPFIIPNEFKKLFNNGHGNAVLKKKENNWFIYIAFKIPCKEEYEPEGWFGIDLGIKNILVLSDKEGKVNKFYNGKELREKRNEYREKRKNLQERKTGENDYWRALKDIFSKESNYSDDVNHKISKEVVEVAKKYRYGIAIEKLKKIREENKDKGKEFNKELHSWRFRDLIDKIKYKAKERGVPVEEVNPKYTSQVCSECGYKDKNNRKNGEFKCKECGFELNADLNASRNIASIPLLPKGRSLLEANR